MSLRALRLGFLVALAALGGTAVWFYQGQNSGRHLGGAISPPKMAWLAYAIAAWFVAPLFLWRDARLDATLRRLFGAFWLAMVARGVAELILLYGMRHWNPLYGIAHDLFCLGLLVVLRRKASSDGGLNGRARRFSGALIASLAAEISFAGMFLQTGSHESEVYFASAEASWGFINLVTTGVLCFAVPDFVALLVGMYFPGTGRETPWLMRAGRLAAAGLAVAVAVGGLACWTWMARVEAKARRFQAIGYLIVDSCMAFKDAFVRGDEPGMADFLRGGDGAWVREPVEHGHAFDLWRWRSGGSPRPLLEAVVEWRRTLPEVLQAAFKIHLMDRIVSDDEAVGQLRFEVTGRGTTDSGVIRCTFRRGADGRWRIFGSTLMEGTSVAGQGRLFRDVAKERGVGFVMEEDRRFVPGERCDGHDCPGPTRLKFQTMRHAYAGAAAADVDGDGADDVFFCAGGRPALYRNRGDGTFEDVTSKAGLDGLWHVNTAGFADLDNDGDQDLFCGVFYGPNHLFRNNGDGTFTDVTIASGLPDDDLVTCFSFFDFDNDGNLDLYLGRFLEAREEVPDSFLYARNGQPNRLYRNDGGLRFADVTAKAGVGETGLTLSVAAADYDGDGDQDLYVANDFGRNVLYQNQGDGTFRDVALETGTLAIGGSMSATWGDYDNDGRLDLYVAAIRSNQRWFVQPLTAQRVVLKFIREGKMGPDNPVFSDLRKYMGPDWVNIGNHALAGNSLLRQKADGTFTDMAEASQARPAGWYWGSGFFDIDHDGDLDIYASDGWITGKDPYDL